MKTGTYKGEGGYTYTVLEEGDEPLILVRRPDGSTVRAKAGSDAKTAIMKELSGKEPDEPLAELDQAPATEVAATKPPEKGMLDKAKDAVGQVKSAAGGMKDSITKAVEAKLAEMKGMGRVPDGQTFMGAQSEGRERFDSETPEGRRKMINDVLMQLGDPKLLEKAMLAKSPKMGEEDDEEAKPEVSAGAGSFRPAASIDVDGDGKPDVKPVAVTGRR